MDKGHVLQDLRAGIFHSRFLDAVALDPMGMRATLSQEIQFQALQSLQLLKGLGRCLGFPISAVGAEQICCLRPGQTHQEERSAQRISFFFPPWTDSRVF